MSGRTHGLASTYRDPKYACRCDACKVANAERARQEQQQRAERLAADPSLAAHGSEATYANWGCRCGACKAAHSAVMAVRNKRRDRRRVRAVDDA